MTNVQSKLWLTLPVSCHQHLHPWTSSCVKATVGLLLSSSPYCLRIYVIFYALRIIYIRFQRRLKRGDLERALYGCLRSTAFLITNTFTFPLYNCLMRQVLGCFNRFTVAFVPAFLASLTAILIERPSRRKLLTLYVGNVASETMWRMAEARGYVRSLPNGQCYVFGASMAILIYLYRLGWDKRDHNDAVYKILQFVVGANEEGPLKQTHSSCPHNEKSCVRYCMDGGLRSFGIGLGLQLSLRLLTSFRNKRLMRWQLNHQMFKIGLAFGGFSLIYRTVSCVLRRCHGRDDAIHAIPATLLASIAFREYPNNTVALYAFWKMLQLVYQKGIDQKLLPAVPGFLPFLYATCTATLFHASIIEPKTLRSSYFRFLHIISGERLCKFHLEPFDAFGYDTSRSMKQVMQQLNIVNHSPLPKYALN